MKLRAIIALGMAALWVVLVGPAVSALAYPPTTCATVSVSTTNPRPGATITVAGANFDANATVRLELHTTTYRLKTVTTDGNGEFSTRVTLPAGVSGNHTIVAVGGHRNRSGCGSDPVQVVGIQHGGTSANHAVNGAGNANASNGIGGTAFTGVDIAALLAAAAALLGIGVALNRRGRTRHAHSHGGSRR